MTDLVFRKSSRSNDQGLCVEVADADTGAVVRDSKDVTGPRLKFDRPAWRRFTESLKR